jgi:flagellar hook-basal body complex protein FliE
MSAIAPLPVAAVDPSFLAPAWQTGLQGAAPADDFAQLLAHGLSQIETKMQAADKIATQFAIDDSVPPHQVIIAMEEARMSMGMMLQVRSRVVQGLTQLMQMQL